MPDRARAAGRPSQRSPGSAPKRWRTTRRCARNSRRRATGARRGAPLPQDRRTALGDRRPRARRRLLRRRPRAAGRSGRPDRARPALPGDRSARLSRRRQYGRHRLGRARACRGGEGGRASCRQRARPREGGDAGPGLQHAGRGARADGPVPAGGRQIEQSIALAEGHELLQAACRGYTNLSVLYSSLDPPRSIETCLRGLETARKVGDLAFQSRLYANLAVAYCALTDRCEAEGIEAARDRHRPRPPARPARPSGRAADRAGPDPPVPRRPCAGLRLLPRGAGAGRTGRRTAACSSPATMVLLRFTSTPGTRAQAEALPGEGPGRLRARRPRARRAHGPAVSLLTGRMEASHERYSRNARRWRRATQAPDFALPAVDGPGTVSLADYRGKSSAVPGAVRRAVVSVLPARDRADGGDASRQAEGAGRRDALASWPPRRRMPGSISNSARRACGWRADPELSTHRAYGVPKPAATPELLKAIGNRSHQSRSG